MATLCVGDVDGSTPLLRDWLAGDWALLFSHPVDFQDQGLEHDRWLDILRDEFRARGVKPIACRRSAGVPDGSWVGELICDYGLLRLESDAAQGGAIDIAARQLRAEILDSPPRFVLIVDESLNRRGILKYSATAADCGRLLGGHPRRSQRCRRVRGIGAGCPCHPAAMSCSIAIRRSRADQPRELADPSAHRSVPSDGFPRA